MQLSQKQKLFSPFSAAFSDIHQISNSWKNKMTLRAYIFSKLETANLPQPIQIQLSKN